MESNNKQRNALFDACEEYQTFSRCTYFCSITRGVLTKLIFYSGVVVLNGQIYYVNMFKSTVRECNEEFIPERWYEKSTF